MIGRIAPVTPNANTAIIPAYIPAIPSHRRAPGIFLYLYRMSMKWHVAALLLVAGAMAYTVIIIAQEYGASIAILVAGAVTALVMIRLGQPTSDSSDPHN